MGEAEEKPVSPRATIASVGSADPSRRQVGAGDWVGWPAAGLLCLVGVLLAGCGDRPGGGPSESAGPRRGEAPPGGPPPVFDELAVPAGLDFVHFNGMSGRWYFLELFGSGAALFDYDNDGDLDAYLVQGSMLGRGTTFEDAVFPPPQPPPLVDRLYRNDTHVGPGGVTVIRFRDVTAASGLDSPEYGMGVAVGDYDRDGWDDLYVTSFGPNRMWRNRGDGTFEEATGETGTGDDRWSMPAAFFDYDRDGWEDLFVGNYVAFDPDDSPICEDLTGRPNYCGPNRFRAEKDRLWRNRGDGTFEDVTAAAGLEASAGPALGVITADLNGDGWTDLYVANDDQPNYLWLNRDGREFTEQAVLAGCAVNRDGQAEASMGVDAGDFDGDGDLDLFMTHLTRQSNTLYVNDGAGLFEDRTMEARLDAPSQAFTSFGSAWLDYDGDGWLDLLIVNGAISRIPALVEKGDPYPVHQTNQLLRGRGDGTFEETTGAAGPVFTLSEVSRGAAFGDVDNDGDVDVLVANNSGQARLLMNRLGNTRRWLGLRLVRGGSLRATTGGAAVLRQGDRRLVRTSRSAGSYLSANDPRILFGLGDEPAGDSVRVDWPGGGARWRVVPDDAYLVVPLSTRGAGSS